MRLTGEHDSALSLPAERVDEGGVVPEPACTVFPDCRVIGDVSAQRGRDPGPGQAGTRLRVQGLAQQLQHVAGGEVVECHERGQEVLTQPRPQPQLMPRAFAHQRGVIG